MSDQGEQDADSAVAAPDGQKGPGAKAAKRVAFLFLAYAGIVISFESMIVVTGPSPVTNLPFPVLVITTIAEDGTSKDRALAILESKGQIFVSTNHWPRGWYYRALENPNVQVTMDGVTADYLAVPATEAECVRVNLEHPFPLALRFLTGFPPQFLLRLDSR